ncbi:MULTISPECIES: hypothetical protein [Glycomyces]|uniref:Lipoprotein n=2 Tax=Glycomyces TaxID=58113 RepID=A0A9X3SXP4_9ACTN|nr:hypothetical protein [Glycomyces lechevalierae]MDA1387182.1 hypothetical protein [Glycomyces lechevalierae]MDR7338554.1 hypothetical protein [Glycomyces lechevalierae]
MRKVVPLIGAAALLLAGCTGQGDGGDPPESAESPSTQVWDEPAAVEAAAPTGFALVEGEERTDLLAENAVTQSFGLTGDEFTSDRLIVTSYVIDAKTSTADYDAQVDVVLAYDETRGFTSEDNTHYPALVHRQDGLQRYTEFPVDDGDAERPLIKQNNYYVFSGNRVVQITCQWRYHFEDIRTACMELTQTLAFPEDW